MKNLKTINAGEEGILGYKAFEPDLTCRGFQYKVGETYELENGEPILCDRGFHFCLEKETVFEFYVAGEGTRLCLVRAYGDVITDGVKCVTSKIEILEEILDTDRDKNTGYWNTGGRNIGVVNTGDDNVGGFNDGCYNTGDNNEGDYNIGCNNRGGNNMGTLNVGNGNIGSGNIGDHNVGLCNVTSGAFGVFNTKPTPIYIFNKPFEGNLMQLMDCHGRAIRIMSDIVHSHLSYHDFIVNYDPVTVLELIEQLPNFDPDIFAELTGLNYSKLREYCLQCGYNLKPWPNSDDI